MANTYFEVSISAAWARQDLTNMPFRFWRPLIPVIEADPLTLCDRQSLKYSDIVPYDVVGPVKVQELGLVKYRDRHEWHWLSNQTKDEPVVFVVWDSLDLENVNENPGT